MNTNLPGGILAQSGLKDISEDYFIDLGGINPITAQRFLQGRYTKINR
jgi:hypothetical protein